MPFMVQLSISRVGFIDGKYVLNPSKKELENSKLDLVVVETKGRSIDGRIRSQRSYRR